MGKILNVITDNIIYFWIVTTVLVIVLLVLVIVMLVNNHRLSRKYDRFMRGKDAENLEESSDSFPKRTTLQRSSLEAFFAASIIL